MPRVREYALAHTSFPVDKKGRPASGDCESRPTWPNGNPSKES